MLKKVILLVFFCFIFSSLQAEELSGDFDGDGRIGLKDIAYGLAFYLNSNATTSTLPDTASSFYSKATGPVTRLPDDLKDDFAGSTGFRLADISVMLASYLSTNNDFNEVESSANTFYSNTGDLYKLPGTPIGTASFTTTITGITTDP